MGRRKKETFYQLLKRRIREHGEAAFEAAQQAVKKLPAEQTEPTRNADHCKRYREHHPEKTKEIIKQWHEKFKREHGMNYSTWHYRKKHGLL